MSLLSYFKKAIKPINADPTPDDDRVPKMIVLPWEQGKELYPNQDYQQLINQYTSWVYVCATKNSNSVAAANLKLYTTKKSNQQKILVKTKKVSQTELKRFTGPGFPHLQKYIRDAVEVEEILEHPFYDLLNSVNPIMNRFDLFDLTELFLELTGNAYWFISRNALGVPEEIWLLPSQYMRIVADRSKLILGYVYQRGTVKIPFEYDEIVHFKFGSPFNQLYGSGPLSAVLETVDYDRSIRTFDRTLMKNMGRPEAVLETNSTLNQDTFKRLKAEWAQNYGGPKKVGKTIILESGLTYKGITMTPREMNYVVGRKLNREEIAAIFGVPMSKLTSEDINRANAREGGSQYQQDTIEPRLRRLEEKVNERVMPMYDENLFVAYDSVVPEDKEFALKDRESRLGSYLTSVNEEREKLGMDKAEWGDIPLVSGGVAPLGSQSESAPEEFEEFPEEQVIASFVDGVIKNVKQKIKS